MGQLGLAHKEEEVGTFHHIKVGHEQEAGRFVDEPVDTGDERAASHSQWESGGAGQKHTMRDVLP